MTIFKGNCVILRATKSCSQRLRIGPVISLSTPKRPENQQRTCWEFHQRSNIPHVVVKIAPSNDPAATELLAWAYQSKWQTSQRAWWLLSD